LIFFVTKGWSNATEANNCTRKAIGYRKNKNGKEAEIKIIKIKKDK
jgi:hypothetical protein